ncbi:hypothetical protein C942_02213 [Photobacterium marinum]|uniref:Uncharacterized protein n=1 Tax=Photobacterium marinum TaxID=1056511 RepID=L8JB38_9GAMM|nr:hypothetical protein [Photobacterium marinum]ELR64642.1 hypothetical protein C942_02213 [Photobacterium marinum]
MSKEAEAQFRAAFERLKAGKPERTKPTGKITLNKINKESGLAHSYIHHKTFEKLREEFSEDIEGLNKVKAKADGEDYVGEAERTIKRLRDDVKTETRRKESYKSDLKELRVEADAAIAKSAIMAHRIFELEARERRCNEANVIKFNNR